MRGTIITFYSYKGGTGRSMAVANTAWILASNGLRVLTVDWDLEAPGLHRYFHPFLSDGDLKLSRGIVDLVWEFAAAAVDPDAPDEPDWHEKFAEISPYAMSLEYEFPGRGTVDFVPAGRQDATYSALVSSFDWENFYDRLGGGGFLEALKRNMRDRYDYVLIDSRTGLSDTAGICTVQLPDILVNCFSLSTQAIDGAAAVAASVGRQRRNGQVRIFPVPMRVEDGEQDKLDAGRDYARSRFGRFLSHVPDPERYWGQVEVPYKSFYAYEEILATIGDRPRQENTVLSATERIVGYLTDQRVTALEAPPSESERRRLLTQFQRSKSNIVPGQVDGMAPRVFISYTYESVEHFEAIRELWFLLRSHGINARMDLPPNQRPPDWTVWLLQELRLADLVLVALSPTFKRFADHGDETGADREPGSEVLLVRDAYGGGVATRRVLPVVLPGGSAGDLPAFMSDVEPVIVPDLDASGIGPLLRQVLRHGKGDEPAGRQVARRWEFLQQMDPALQYAAARLGDFLIRHWTSQGMHREDSMLIRWSAVGRSIQNIPMLAEPWPEGLDSRGATNDLAETFLALPSGHLVILGVPGSGKSTALVRLAIGLLTVSGSRPLPIPLPARSWRPDVEPLDSWIIRQVQQDYPGAIKLEDLEQLMAAGMLLPVVDGLDELPQFLRGMAFRALSGTGLPVVVTCRTAEYRMMVTETVQTLRSTTVIDLEPVTVDEQISYLRESSSRQSARWDPVVAHLRRHTNAPLAEALATPAMLEMARDAYSGADIDPAELIDTARFPDRTAIEHRLIDSFISTAYVQRPDGLRSGQNLELEYRPESAHRWLRFLARWMQDENAQDLAWWRLYRAGSSLPGRLLFAMLAGSGLVALAIYMHIFIGVVAGCLLGAIVAAAGKPSSRPSQYGLRTKASVTYLPWLPRLRRPADLSRSPSPDSTVQKDRRAAWLAGLIWGLGFYFLMAFVVLVLPLAGVDEVLGLAIGTIVGPAVFSFHLSTSAWGWFTVARLLLAMRGRLPWRLMRFLDDAHKRGVLRQEGAVYQFRYVRLQDRLAEVATQR